jgi:protease YdgD
VPGPGARTPGVAPAATPVAIFGTDDRVPVPAKYHRLQEGIGLLYNNRSRTVCTAFCVGDNIVATAGHCLHRTAGETAPPIGAFVFARTRGPGSSMVKIAGSSEQSAQQNVVSGSLKLSVRPPIDAASDWALVRLGRPVCAGHTLETKSMGVDEIAKAAGEQRLFQLSYHRDFADWRLAYSQPCASGRTIGGASPAALARDFAEPGNLVLHTCDTGGASSGSPLLVDGERGPVVVGINVGTYVQSEVVIEDGNVIRRSKAASVANTAVSATAFRDRLAAFRAAEILPNGDRMRLLQDGLRQRKLYDGALDGRYGPKVRSAILAFEQQSGSVQTGIASQGLLMRLMPTSATSKAPAVPVRARVRS